MIYFSTKNTETKWIPQATNLSSVLSSSFKDGNSTFPWQIHPWALPNKESTLEELGRAVRDVTDSANSS